MNTSSRKREVLEEVAREVSQCRKCRLWASRNKPVPGYGNPDAEVLFIGEAPGYNEDLEGKPFVGAAGKFLDQLLGLAGLRRSEVFITNILKCRPPNNRDPLPDEVEACTPYLDRQVRAIEPKLIVCLGRHSAKYVLSRAGVRVYARRDVGITAVRGQVFTASYLGLRVAVVPTYHPAAGLYNPKLKRVLIEDFTVIGKLLENLRRGAITL
ncbi:MAG: uracil-DNA glycosylase [Thermoprotei archaeon]|nr:MAG: uracil-DNA glycosylase [Thermoprotei archaeon]